MFSIFHTHFKTARLYNSDISCQMAAASLKKRRGKGGLWKMKISKQRVAGVRSDQIISRPNTSELVTCGPRQRHQARIMLLAPPQLGELRPGGCRRLRTRTAFRTRTSLIHFSDGHGCRRRQFTSRPRTRTGWKRHLLVVDDHAPLDCNNGHQPIRLFTRP